MRPYGHALVAGIERYPRKVGATGARAFGVGAGGWGFGCSRCVTCGSCLPLPLQITKRMPEKKIQKRSSIKPFFKVVNYSHVMPTRYCATPSPRFPASLPAWLPRTPHLWPCHPILVSLASPVPRYQVDMQLDKGIVSKAALKDAVRPARTADLPGRPARGNPHVLCRPPSPRRRRRSRPSS